METLLFFISILLEVLYASIFCLRTIDLYSFSGNWGRVFDNLLMDIQFDYTKMINVLGWVFSTLYIAYFINLQP